MLFLHFWAEVHSCTENFCLNGGSCHKNGAVHTCSCAPGYAGDRCQTGRVFSQSIWVSIWVIVNVATRVK